jgi:hypothetical protein
MRQTMRDFFFGHLGRMPFIMKENESLNPMNVALFNLCTVMPCPDRLPDLIEQLGFLHSWRCRSSIFDVSSPSITANGWFLALLA